MKKVNRRYFFSKVSIGAIGAVLLSKLPFGEINNKNSKIKSKVKISKHPYSVKRIK